MITTRVRNLDQLKDFITTLPRRIRGEATEVAAEYLIGNDRRGLKHYPARVKHGADNPYQWQSEKQRRAYFASNGFGGGIPYSRTNALKDGWTTKNDGAKTAVTNDVPYAGFVMGDEQQKGHRADKWRLVPEIIKTNTAGMIQAVRQFVDRWIKENQP